MGGGFLYFGMPWYRLSNIDIFSDVSIVLRAMPFKYRTKVGDFFY